ncbi:MAG TPA: FxSxx-COOH system tetratricopeptide repeat protein [Micromonosporaceae bacterium]|nr:FxSxx-COOH system tetratricopeptide repeat protein [Micromonosporaceae bacterium]
MPTTGRVITFYSYKGGSGRTMALASVAWILASNGKRVLAVDWDLESPGLQRYFHPFLADKQLRTSTGVIDLIRDYAAATMEPRDGDNPRWFEDYARVLSHAVSLRWTFEEPGVVDFLPAGRQGLAYAEAVSTFDWANFYERLRGGAFLTALREDMRANYDYVLIDSRTGMSDTAGICTVHLPDVVVDCFTLSSQSIDGAAQVAYTIRAQRGERGIVLLPVPMRVEDAEQLKLEAGRDYARQRFEPFLSHLTTDQVSRYWGDVEIPYKPFYAYEEILAPFGDRPHQENSLLAAYERLTTIITDGEVTELGAMDERQRRMLLGEYERPKQSLPTDILISYASADRAWAEWIAAQLVEVGIRAVAQEVEFGSGPGFADEIARSLGTASRTLVLLSQDYVRAENAEQFWHLVADRDTTGGRFLVPVRLDSVRPPLPFADRLPIDLSGVTTERQAREAIFGELDLPSYPASGTDMATDVDTVPRFPRTPPRISNLPQRNATFTGRSAVLDALRDRLTGNATVVVQALYGMGGVGKTQVALEYAYRFAAYYDIVWWISAEQPGLVRSGLAALAERLALPAAENVQANVDAVLEALRQGDPSPRWLLVFDNAGEPEALRQYLPSGPGHVLLTSRDQAWAQQVQAEPVQVDVFRREESLALLRKSLPEMGEDDASALAAKLGDLPLAIVQAGAWLAATGMPVDQYLDLLDTQLPRILEEHPPPGYQWSVASTWLVSLDRLRAEKPAAAKLLELCAFFAPEPIPMWLVTGDRFTDVLLPYDPLLRDPILKGYLIREIGKYALARLDTGRPSIQLHRLVQAVIRGILSEDEAREDSRHVQEILAAANPKDPDDRAKWPIYEDILPHLVVSGALESTNPDVRQMIADVVRFHYKISDYSSSQELAERALAQWEATAADPNETDVLLLRFHLANSLRSQAKFEQARDIDEAVNRELSHRLGADHPYTIMSLGSMAADLRAIGEYRAARELQEEAYDRSRQVLGDDNERTLMAANNLGVSLRLVGDFQAALRLDEQTYHRRLEVSPPGHSYVLFCAINYARSLRDVGRFQASRELLESVVRAYREQGVGEAISESLRAARSLAIALRKLGHVREAHDLTETTLAQFVNLHGARHPETLACQTNLAIDQSALGDDQTALATSRAAYETYRVVLGEFHPFTLACLNNVAIFTRLLGRADESRALSTRVVDSLREHLGESHPYTLACTVNLANSLFDDGDLAAACDLDEQTHRGMRDVLGADHPDVVAVQSNLAISRAATGDDVGARALYADALARSLRTMGDGHPNVMAIRNGVRLNCDIDPPPP